MNERVRTFSSVHRPGLKDRRIPTFNPSLEGWSTARKTLRFNTTLATRRIVSRLGIEVSDIPQIAEKDVLAQVHDVAVKAWFAR